MKAAIAATAAVAAAGAYAQQSVSSVTMTVDDCSSMPMETMITVTEGTTVTYCPECDMGGPGYTTVYTTTYLSLCPTGTVPATYTVTESCTGDHPTWTPGPSHIPQGFTVTEKVCHVCESTPTTLTITEPCGCEAHEGTPVPNPNPMPTPSSGGSPPSRPPSGGSSPPEGCNGDDCGGNGNQSPPPPTCNGDDCGGNGNQSPPPPSCNGEDCGGSPPPSGMPTPKPPGTSPGHGGGVPPYPTPTTTTEQCPGPQCRTKVTGVPPGNITVPPNNGASNLGSMAFLSSAIMAVVVAALAFAL